MDLSKFGNGGLVFYYLASLTTITSSAEHPTHWYVMVRAYRKSFDNE